MARAGGEVNPCGGGRKLDRQQGRWILKGMVCFPVRSAGKKQLERFFCAFRRFICFSLPEFSRRAPRSPKCVKISIRQDGGSHALKETQ
jgi:hypothetical protein